MIYYRVMDEIIYRVPPHYVASWRNRSETRLGSRETYFFLDFLDFLVAGPRKKGTAAWKSTKSNEAKIEKRGEKRQRECAIKSVAPSASEQSNGPTTDNLVEAFRHLGPVSFPAQ